MRALRKRLGSACAPQCTTVPHLHWPPLGNQELTSFPGSWPRPGVGVEGPRPLPCSASPASPGSESCQVCDAALAPRQGQCSAGLLEPSHLWAEESTKGSIGREAGGDARREEVGEPQDCHPPAAAEPQLPRAGFLQGRLPHPTVSTHKHTCSASTAALPSLSPHACGLQLCQSKGTSACLPRYQMAQPPPTLFARLLFGHTEAKSACSEKAETTSQQPSEAVAPSSQI